MVSLERGWANSKPPVASPWSNSGPSATCHSADAGPIPHYWPCLFQGKLGQSHAIGIVSLEGDWANSMLSVAPLWGDHGPSAAHRSAGAGPIQCYRHCLFRGGLGLLKDIGSTSWSDCRPSPACHLAGAGPIPCYWPCLFRGELGQSHDIGILSLERAWANSKLSVAPLWRDCGPSAVHHPAGAGPIPCYWRC